MTRRQIADGLYHLFGHHVNKRPIFIVLSVFDERPIDVAETLAHLFEAIVVASVARKVDFSRRALKQESRPEGIAWMQGTSGEVLCGKAVELHPVADARCLVPIQFYDAIGRITPAFEMFAHTEGTNHAANAFANRFHGAIV